MNDISALCKEFNVEFNSMPVLPEDLLALARDHIAGKMSHIEVRKWLRSMFDGSFQKDYDEALELLAKLITN